MKESSGIVIISKNTNRFLLLHRVNDPIVWSVVSGKMESGEDPYQTIKREIEEEIRINSDLIEDISKVGVVKTNKKLFHVFVGFVENEFKIPNLKLDENDKYGWFDEENLPTPIHKRWDKTFQFVKPFLNLRECFKRNLDNLLNG